MAYSENSETLNLVIAPDGNILDRPQTLRWRIFHGTHYMLGGLCFILGSCMYFDQITKDHPMALHAGGWLFTIGSFFFLLADLQEWWYYRIGCCFDKQYRDAFEATDGDLFKYSRFTMLGRLERAEVGINFFMSACGSALYLAGSILFIPAFEKYVVVGEWLFIIGSAVIYSSQAWKVYRSACTNATDRHDHRFRVANVLNDKPALGVDGFAGIGGVFYFFGTIFFLPRFNVGAFGANRSATLFVFGGTCFTLSGLFLQYRHYCTRHK